MRGRFVPQPRVLTNPTGLCQDFSVRDAKGTGLLMKTASFMHLRTSRASLTGLGLQLRCYAGDGNARRLLLIGSAIDNAPMVATTAW